MGNQLVLDNREWIEIVNTKGDSMGGFYWNPTDLDIVKRYEKVAEEFTNIQIPKDDDMEALCVASDKVSELFDYFLNSSHASEQLFAGANPFTPRPEGIFLCEYVMDAVCAYIEKELDVRIRKTNARIKKYTEKYKK